MRAKRSNLDQYAPAPPGGLADRSGMGLLRAVVIAAGIGWSAAFVVIGLGYALQLYGDGAIFSYAVAVQDAWAFHLHNISGRLSVYVFAFVPAEVYVGLSGNAAGGIVFYGFLHFAAPLLGLAATFAADRSRDRVIFIYACFSMASLCPLVFGFPTEMWMAHALLWPTLAVCHYARGGSTGFFLVIAMLLALVFTHAGAIIFALVILATLALRGMRDAALRRAAGAFIAVMAIWAVVEVALPPDDYITAILARAALNFINIASLADGLSLLLIGALAGYAIAVRVLRRPTPAGAEVYAAVLVALALAAYWLWFDHALHTENRYFLRTALLIAAPALGAMAMAHALAEEDRLKLAVPLLPQLTAALPRAMTARTAIGAFLLLMLVHAVETAKFVTAWSHYKAAVRALAMGNASDPALGDARFVSSARIPADLNRLAWSSTTPYLSVLVAPNFAPARLVVDPAANYFWLSCKTATANQEAARAIPTQSRALMRVHACLHRP